MKAVSIKCHFNGLILCFGAPYSAVIVFFNIIVVTLFGVILGALFTVILGSLFTVIVSA